MNKAFLLVLALAAPACGKHNEIDVLVHEANAAAKFYVPQLDALDARVQAIFQRGATIPASTPGIDAVGSRLTEARDTIVQMRAIVAPGADGKSTVEKNAAAAAKDHKVEDLDKLLHDTHATLDRAITIVNDDLASVESWISYYDRQALAMPLPPRMVPPEPAPVVPPPPPTTPTAPTVPGGAQTEGHAPAPAGGAAAPAHP